MAKPLKSRSTIRFHTGTNEAIGEIVVLDQHSLEPGGTALCQIRLEDPIVVVPGDPFILRLHSPLHLLGGGSILGTSEYRLKAGKDFVIERLQKKEDAVDSLHEQIVLAIQENRFQPKTLREIATKVNRVAAEIEEDVQKLTESGELIVVKGKGACRFIDQRSLGELQQKVLQTLQAFHKESPLRIALLKSKLAQTVGIDPTLLLLVTNGTDLIEDHAAKYVKDRDHKVVLDIKEQALATAIQALFEARPYETPRKQEAVTELLGKNKSHSQKKVEDVLEWLLESGQILVIGDNILLLKSSHEAAQQIVVEMIKEKGSLSTADFRGRLETSRKYAIPILENFDKIGLTRREGDIRVLC